jgi:hypothetical protein
MPLGIDMSQGFVYKLKSSSRCEKHLDQQHSISNPKYKDTFSYISS